MENINLDEVFEYRFRSKGDFKPWHFDCHGVEWIAAWSSFDANEIQVVGRVPSPLKSTKGQKYYLRYTFVPGKKWVTMQQKKPDAWTWSSVEPQNHWGHVRKSSSAWSEWWERAGDVGECAIRALDDAAYATFVTLIKGKYARQIRDTEDRINDMIDEREAVIVKLNAMRENNGTDTVLPES